MELSTAAIGFEFLGASTTVRASILDQYGQSFANSEPTTWHILDIGVAEVDAVGKVIAVGQGTTLLVGSVAGLSDTATVRVEQVPSLVEVTPAQIAFAILGDTLRLSATASDRGGSPIPGASFVWDVSDETVGTVDASGLVTSVGVGTAIVRAETQGVSGEVGLSVMPVVVEIRSAVDSVHFSTIGAEFTVPALAFDAGGSLLPGVPIEWTSTNLNVVTADSTGALQAVGDGTAGVRASSGTATHEVTVTVLQRAATLELSPNSDTLDWLGDTLRVSVAVVDSGGTPVAQPRVAWASLSPHVVVDSAGLVTAYAVGSAMIVALQDGVADTADVQVRQVPWQLTLQPDSLSLSGPGASAPVLVSLIDRGGSSISASALMWTARTPGVAMVDQGAGGTQATGLIPGSTWLVAESGLLSDSIHVEVAAPLSLPVLRDGLTMSVFRACALDSSGRALCWGDNDWGALGDGTRTDRDIPVAVSGGRRFEQIALPPGGHRACALAGGGDVYCWGKILAGEFPQFPNEWIPTPIRIAVPEPAVQTVVGKDFGCALGTSGQAYCWGRIEIGVPTIAPFPPTPLPGGHRLTRLAAGSDHACGLDVAGAVICWGYGGKGQLGDGNQARASGPVAALVTERFVHLAAGPSGTCAVTAAGKVVCWGSVPLGNSTSIPLEIPGLVDVRKIAMGNTHGCALTHSGTILCYGTNTVGELGNGSYSNSSTPVPVASGLTFSDVATGGATTCARALGGEVYCWGSNVKGALGTGQNPDELIPVPVTGGAGFDQVSTGGGYTCALNAAGEAYCWGGAHGLNGPTRFSSLRFKQLSANELHGCGIDLAGAAHCWGLNDMGQLGRPGGASTMPVPVASSVAFHAISTGQQHTCAISTGGAGFCWGDDNFGKLGIGYPGPTAYYEPRAILGGHELRAIDATYNATCAVDVDHAGLCWGYQSGTIPEFVAPGTNFVALSPGWVSHRCGIDIAGTGVCWGSPTRGQLGVGLGLGWSQLPPTPVAGGHTFSQIDASRYFTCALGASGDVYCWGLNEVGQLGDGTTEDQYSPVRTLLPGPASAISVGIAHACALLAGGQAYCWGSNQGGKVGVPLFANSPLPLRVLGT